MNTLPGPGSNPVLRNFGFFVALTTSILTLITFGIAIMTPPLSGPYCPGDCFEYPYLDIASRWPRDYYWMFPAMALTLFYMLLAACVYEFAPAKKKLFGLIGLAFALLATGTLMIDYFLQVTVIQPSVVRGEGDGISLLTQYNDHGVFIALEEAGYLLMSFSFFSMSAVFSSASHGERFLRWIFSGAFYLVIAVLAIISVIHGTERSYIFEIAVISINWLALAVAGFVLSGIFRKTGT